MLKVCTKRISIFFCDLGYMKLKYMNIFLGNVCVDVIILDPKWLCYTVMGSLLTPEFIKKSRPTGYYSIEELRTATSWESVDTMLPILESLGLCAKVSNTRAQL